MAQLVKNLPAMWETWVGKIPWRREWLLQYSGLENSMDYIVHGVAESDTTEQLTFGNLRGALLNRFCPELNVDTSFCPGQEAFGVHNL